MRFILFFTCLLLSVSCTEKIKSSQTLEIDIEQGNQINDKVIADLVYEDYVLGEDAVKLVSNWQKYQELVQEVEKLKQTEFSFFKDDKSVLKGLFKDLKATVPNQIKTNAVESRTLVVEAAALKLHSNLNISNLNKQDVLKSIREMLSAVSSLNNQINKKLEFDANNISRP